MGDTFSVPFILSCSYIKSVLVLSLSLNNKMMSWQHRNVVLTFYRLFLFGSIFRLIVYWFDRLIDVYYSNIVV